MVGIFGCVLKDGNAAPIVHSALKRIEYRGYDSVGEVTLHENKLFIKRIKAKSMMFINYTIWMIFLEG